jgi:carbamoyl-phosphate synthase large subunit
MVNILITGIGSTTAISVIKGFRKQNKFDLKIVGTDINEINRISGSSFCDRFYTVPPATHPNYVPELLEICEKEKVQVIIPIVDIELEIVSSKIELFEEKGIFVCLSENKTINLCNDKYMTYKFLIANNYPTPTSWTPEEIEYKQIQTSFPLIVKPRNGVSSKSVYRVESNKELEIVIKKVNNPIIQECLEGKEYTVDVFNDCHSNLVIAVPRERIETKAGISFKGRTVKNDRLMHYSKSIAKKLNIKGACNIQYIIDEEGPKCIEINPRFSGSLPLTIEAGVNMPLLSLEMAIGKDLSKDICDFKEGVYMTRYWEEVFYES